MPQRQPSHTSTREFGLIGDSPSRLHCYVVSALVLSVCLVAGASAVLTETQGPYYALLYSDLTPLVAGGRSLSGCAPLSVGDASDAPRDGAISAHRFRFCSAMPGMGEAGAGPLDANRRDPS